MTTLTGEAREMAIINILRQLDAVHPHGRKAEDLQVGLRVGGFPDIQVNQVASLLTDMANIRYAVPIKSGLAGEVTRWQRTEEGRVVLAQLNL